MTIDKLLRFPLFLLNCNCCQRKAVINLMITLYTFLADTAGGGEGRAEATITEANATNAVAAVAAAEATDASEQ